MFVSRIKMSFYQFLKKIFPNAVIILSAFFTTLFNAVIRKLHLNLLASSKAFLCVSLDRSNHRKCFIKDVPKNSVKFTGKIPASEFAKFLRTPFITEHTVFYNDQFCLNLVLLSKLRKQPLEVFCKKAVLRNFTKFTGKHLHQSLFFNKVAGLSPAALLKKRLCHRCFL